MDDGTLKEKEKVIDKLQKENMALKCENSSLLQRISLLNESITDLNQDLQSQ